MANRVVLGARGAAFGMWVSKPGFDVLTTGDTNMLLSTGNLTFQVLTTGRVFIGTDQTFSVNVTIPNYGYKPLILAFSRYQAKVTYASNTSVNFSQGDQFTDTTWDTGDAAYLDYAIIADRMET